MAIDLRQSTASQEIPLGYFVDSTDGNTAETALSIANTDIKLWKTGATTLADKNSGGATHISNGIYYTTLDATDTNTIGPMVIFVKVSGALGVRVECNVLDEAVYDVKYGTTAPATATNITSGTITTATNVTTVNGLASGVVTAASIAASALNGKGDWNIGKTGYSLTNLTVSAATTLASGTHNPQTGDSYARIGATGSGLTSLAPSATALSTATWTGTRAGYIDNLNSATGVTLNATQGLYAPAKASDIPTADITAILADTNELQTDWANGGRLDLILDARASQASVDAIQGDIDGMIIELTNIQGALTTIDGIVDDILVDTGTTIPAQISALNDFDPATDIVAHVTLVDTTTTNTDMVADVSSDVTAIKAKTDSLTFTVAGQVDSNIKYVHGVEITGTGATGDEWGPA